MAYTIQYAYVSAMGKVRLNHEDNFWCEGKYLPEQNEGTDGIVTGSLPGNAFCGAAVLDGMGGECCGETAAFLGAKKFGEYLENYRPGFFFRDPEAYIRDLTLSMNKAVTENADENKIMSMGSTVVLALFTRWWIHLANLGDSRIYVMNREGFRQVSRDHVLRSYAFGKAPLVQYLGMEDDEDTHPEPTVVSLHPEHDMQILLCTDGLTDMVPDPEIEKILNEEKDVSAAVEKLLNTALENGGRDNTTIWLGKIKRQGISWLPF